MHGEEYRVHLLRHAAKRGYAAPMVSGNDWIFADPESGAKAILEFEPRLTEKSGYLIYAKGVLTSAKNSASGIMPEPRYSPRHPKRANPSSNMIDDWLYADYVPETDSQREQDCRETVVGKWLIFSTSETVDQDWRIVKTAVESGALATGAKVSTRLNARHYRQDGEPRHYVICVYTLDWRNKEDVFHHRETLRQLGFTRVLFYKTDEMTLQGKHGSIYRG